VSDDIARPFGFIVVRPNTGQLVPEVIINPTEIESVFQVTDGIRWIPCIKLKDGREFNLFMISFEGVGKMVDIAMREQLQPPDKT
jgi:hypothetical protein